MNQPLMIVLATLALLSCTEAGQPVLAPVAPDLSGEQEAAADTAASVRVDGGLAELPGGEAQAPDDLPELEDFGQPCYGNDDCEEGLCVETPPGFVCTRRCDSSADCPDQWNCATPTGDAPGGNYCIPLHGPLCRPCLADDNCRAGHDSDAACVAYGGTGTFCASSCEPGNPCPEGYACQIVNLPDGTSRSLCISSAGCSCAKKYGKELLPTHCYLENSAGICQGERFCSGGVLSSCSAQIPAPESCNGTDDDCDGKLDEPGAIGCVSAVPDEDGDGFGVAGDESPCLCPEGQPRPTPQLGDCDDDSASTFPGAPELCNGKDDNCNGLLDEGLSVPWYRDFDGDGMGTPGYMVMDCKQPDGFVELGIDCVDFNDQVFPGAPELCNDIDDNCNGLVDEELELVQFHPDKDLDGFGTKLGLTLQKCLPLDGLAPMGWASSQDDCNDNDASVHPGATPLCDGKDNNCDGLVDQLCFTKCEGNWPYKPQQASAGGFLDVSDLLGDGDYELFYNSGVNFSALSSTGTPLLEQFAPQSGLTFRARTRFADLDEYDTKPLIPQSLEIITSHHSKLTVYRMTDSGTIEALPGGPAVGGSGARIVATDTDLDGIPEFFVNAASAPLAKAFRFDRTIGEAVPIFDVLDPQGKNGLGNSMLLDDRDGDGFPEFWSGNGYYYAESASQFGGVINIFTFNGKPATGTSHLCNGPGCFDLAIPGLYPFAINILARYGDIVAARASYYSTPEFVSLNDRQEYDWQFGIDGLPLAGWPKLVPKDPAPGAFDADYDGIAEFYPEGVLGTLVDVDGDGYADLIEVVDQFVRIHRFVPALDGWQLLEASSIDVTGQKLGRSAMWDVDGDGRLELLAIDASFRLHCLQLGANSWHPRSSLLQPLSSHYYRGDRDSFEPNDGKDLNGDGVPDTARYLPSALTARGLFYAWLAAPDDEDYYVVDAQWYTEICLTSPRDRNYHLAVYSYADKWNNETQAPKPDGKPDGLIWSDESAEPTKCFFADDVAPARWGEYRYAVRIWSDGDYSNSWPYWLNIPK